MRSYPTRDGLAPSPRPASATTPARTGRPALLAPAALVALALLALALRPSPAGARESDLTQPIDVRADRSEYDERAGTQTLIGNVEISQGTLRITAERVAIVLEGSKLARIDGSGTPIRFEQENEEGEMVSGEAREIGYDASAGTLVLSGAATLSQPGQSVSSERISFDSRTQKVSAEGGPGGEGEGDGRVSIRIAPPTDTGQ